MKEQAIWQDGEIMKFLVVTGLSGAGKSQAINALEDIGFFCIDNVPPEMLVKFAELSLHVDNSKRFAVVTDVRSYNNRFKILEAIDEVRAAGIEPKLLFLECDEQTLVRRYKETRRRHPLMVNDQVSLEEAVETERNILSDVRNEADYIIDTSLISSGQLKDRVKEMFLEGDAGAMGIRIMSFGFKYGLPLDADLVLDVRCLPNPFYVAELKAKTGLSPEVRNYVFSFPEARQLKDKLFSLLEFLIPMYIKEGKSQLVVAFGCTGGKHRSVSFAHTLTEYLACNYPSVFEFHRDVDKH